LTLDASAMQNGSSFTAAAAAGGGEVVDTATRGGTRHYRPILSKALLVPSPAIPTPLSTPTLLAPRLPPDASSILTPSRTPSPLPPPPPLPSSPSSSTSSSESDFRPIGIVRHTVSLQPEPSIIVSTSNDESAPFDERSSLSKRQLLLDALPVIQPPQTPAMCLPTTLSPPPVPTPVPYQPPLRSAIALSSTPATPPVPFTPSATRVTVTAAPPMPPPFTSTLAREMDSEWS